MTWHVIPTTSPFFGTYPNDDAYQVRHKETGHVRATYKSKAAAEQHALILNRAAIKSAKRRPDVPVSRQ